MARQGDVRESARNSCRYLFAPPSHSVNPRVFHTNSRGSLRPLSRHSVSRTVAKAPSTPDRTRCPVGKALQMESVVGAAREGMGLILGGSISARRPTHTLLIWTKRSARVETLPTSAGVGYRFGPVSRTGPAREPRARGSRGSAGAGSCSWCHKSFAGIGLSQNPATRSSL
jgi:hypothetical protein